MVMTRATCDVLFYDSLDAPIAGKLWLAATEHGLCAITFGGDEAALVSGLQETWGLRPLRDSQALADAKKQVNDYLVGKRKSFNLPLDLRALSPFQRQVLEATLAIPRGQTASYKSLAESIGSPKAARAIGNVQATNPIPIVIPCHRVVGSDGSLTGYGGGIHVKQALLRLEGALP
jgi:O-6-methylguanine DNA methyltransferase